MRNVIPEKLIPHIGPHSMRLYDMATGSLYLFFRLFLQMVGLFLLLAAPALVVLGVAITFDERGVVIGPVLYFVAIIAMYSALFYYMAAVVLAVDNYLNKVTLSAGQLVRRMRGNLLFRVFAAGFIQVAIIYAALSPILLLFWMDVTGTTGTALASGIVLLVAVLWAFAFTSVIFVQPAVVIERSGPLQAVKRSWMLARGLRTRVTLAAGLFYLILLLLYQGLHAAHGVVLPWVMEGLPELVLIAILLPAGTAFPVLLYHDAMERQRLVTPSPVGDI